jgi:cytochrome c oxidase subunit 3
MRRRRSRKMPEAQPAFQFADLRQQHEVAQLGMWAFLASEVLLFGGLLFAYFVYRLGYPSAFAAAAVHTKIVIGVANTAILLTSSFAVAWATAVGKLQQWRLAAGLLWAAALMGLVFLGLKGLEYAQEYAEHLIPGIDFSFAEEGPKGAELFFVFYFIATGLHAVHVSIGIAVLWFTARQVRAGAYSAGYQVPLTVAALYWHFVDAVWVVLFALIYLPGRNGL